MTFGTQTNTVFTGRSKVPPPADRRLFSVVTAADTVHPYMYLFFYPVLSPRAPALLPSEKDTTSVLPEDAPGQTRVLTVRRGKGFRGPKGPHLSRRVLLGGPPAGTHLAHGDTDHPRGHASPDTPCPRGERQGWGSDDGSRSRDLCAGRLPNT